MESSTLIVLNVSPKMIPESLPIVRHQFLTKQVIVILQVMTGKSRVARQSVGVNIAELEREKKDQERTEEKGKRLFP